MAILPEEINVKGLEKWFKKEDIYYIKTVGNALTRSGVPDLIANINGHFVGLEAKKAKGGKTTPLQEANKDWIIRTNGYCYIVDDFEEIIVVLKELMK